MFLVSFISSSVILISLQTFFFFFFFWGGGGGGGGGVCVASIRTEIHRLSVIIYGSMKVKFMETQYFGHIIRYGTPIFGNSVFYVS